MADLSDGGIRHFRGVLPGDHLVAAGIPSRPCTLLNVAGYYDALPAMFDHGVAEGFIRPRHRAMVLAEADPHRLIERMRGFAPPDAEKWITPRER